jgi:transposase
MRPTGTAQELENRRRLAVRRVREGYSPDDVARFLAIHIRSLYRWLARARDQGERVGLNHKPHLGPQRRLDIEQDLEVLSWLLYPATSYGFPTPLWTAARVARKIEERFGVHYHPRYVNAWLRERGVTPQKPRRQARERDAPTIDRWLAEDWPRLWQQAEREDGWVVFLDEAGLLLEPLWRRTQAPRGCPPVVETPKVHRRKVSLIGAVAWAPQRGEVRLFTQTLPDGYFDGPKVATFVGQMLQELTGSVVVIWDRGTMHKGPAIREVKDSNDARLELVFQPAYAPEVNPVEKLWSWLKYGRLANFVARNIWHLEAIAWGELEVASQDAQLLESFFRATDLPLTENRINQVAENMALAA